jgi:acetolactate synthase-1/2/3 large subunit
VLVDVPRDVQEELVAPERLEDEPEPLAPPPAPAAAAVREAVRLLEGAARPVVYAGGGVANAEAAAELHELVAALGAPVVTTLMGKGCFDEAQPLFVGHPGMHGSRRANLALNGADLVLAVGARFDDRVTGRLDAFAPVARVVQLDVDPREVGKIRRADVALVGDLRGSLRALRAALRPDPSRAMAWRAELAVLAAREPYPYDRDAAGPLKPQRVLERLDALTAGRDVVFTTGVGQHQMWAMQYLQRRAPRGFVTSGGLATMGYGLPAAIGAKLARPHSTVVCVDGDGSFQMTSQELATAVQERLPVIVVIVDNGCLGMVQQWQTLFFEERLSQVELGERGPDYAALAHAYGARAATVDDEAGLDAALAEALEAGETTVIDARVDPREQVFPMIPPGAAAVDCVEWAMPPTTALEDR